MNKPPLHEAPLGSGQPRRATAKPRMRRLGNLLLVASCVLQRWLRVDRSCYSAPMA
jgi:hypothetical protein